MRDEKGQTLRVGKCSGYPVRGRDTKSLTQLVALVALSLAACSGGDDAVTTTVVSAPAGGDEFPSVVEVASTYNDDGTFDFDVTMTSPYDTPERYADGWRVVGPDGTVYGTHTLAHDHANEQPFTRQQSGVEIPDDVTEVVVEGRDLVNGFGGETRTVLLARDAGS